MIRNIMTVDLEDYYCDQPFANWNEYENRVVGNTRIILELFERYHVTATFFTLILKRECKIIAFISSICTQRDGIRQLISQQTFY